MSTPLNSPGKRKPLIKQSPLNSFQKLTARTDESGNEALKEARQIAIDLIDPNPRQPRQTFNDDSLKELADDIRERGILQPPIVRPVGADRFEIVVGERRYRASKMAGLKSIPVLVRDLDDQDAEITSLIENIQRENLSLSDEANYFNMLKDKYGYSISDIAENVAHKSRSYVDVRLRLSEHPAILKLVETEQIGLQRANLLLRLEPATMQQELKKVQASLQTSQTVFSKDTSLQTAQTKELPSPQQAADRAAAQLTKPFVTISREIEKVLTRFERAEESEKAVIMEGLEQLEHEIARLKRKLKGR